MSKSNHKQIIESIYVYLMTSVECFKIKMMKIKKT